MHRLFRLLFFSMLMFCATVNAQFLERAGDVGIQHYYFDYASIGGGVALFDMNNDDLLDMFLTGGSETEKLYINNGTGFDRVVTYLKPEDFEYFDLYAVSVGSGDVNSDGFDDILLGTMDFLSLPSSPVLLMLNARDGTFDAVPYAESGFTDIDWTAGVCTGDINEDGYLDVFTSNYIDSFNFAGDNDTAFTHVGTRNRLYINNGDATFTEMAASYGITINRNSLTSAFTDYDTDGDADIYVINDFGEFTGPNELYRNDFPSASVTDVSAESRADIGLYGMGIAIGDYDGDLDLDYYVTNIGANILLRNDGSGAFDEVADQAGVADELTPGGYKVGWGTGFFDYDNDGDLDLYVANGYLESIEFIHSPAANPNALYRNNGDGSFTDVTIPMGLYDASQYRGSAMGDLNNDGMIDLVMVAMNDDQDSGLVHPTAVYYNITSNDNNWVKFKLKGTESNPNGFGALVYLYDNSGRVQVRECDGGSTHASSNSPYIHFGIGQADAIDSVVVKWPRGIVQSVRSPAINQLNTIVEAESDTSVQTGLFEQRLVFSAWPNPFTDHIDIVPAWDVASSGKWQYGLYNAAGEKVLSGDAAGPRHRIHRPGLADGIYLLKLQQDGRRPAVRKMIRLSE